MISVAVISFNRRDCLRRCLDGLYAQQGGVPFEIRVIDQGSTDGSLELIRADQAAHPALGLAILPDPSLNAKRNRGLELARFPRVAFIDDDAVPEPDWIAALARAFEAPGRALVTGSVLPLTPGYRRTVRDSPRPRLWTNRFADKLVLWRCGVGTNMAVHQDCVKKIGPFDPAVGTGTALGGCGDEMDFFLRALEAGFDIQYDPAVRVRHHQSADPAVLERRMWNYYYGIAALMRRKYPRHPVTRPMLALRLAHAATLLAAHAALARRDLVRGDLAAVRGTWRGWFGA